MAAIVGGAEAIGVTPAVDVVSAVGEPDGIGVVAGSAGGAVCVLVAGAGIACEGSDGGGGSDPSAHALIGSTRATAPTAAMASGRTRAGVNRQRNPVFVSSR